jgi:Tol biopolymer transport system component
VWTADGHNIIFTSALAWELNLWRVSLSDSGGPKPLFVGSNKDRSPTISHQGNRLAFTRRVSDRNIYRLSLTEATAKSSQPVRFLQSSRDEFNPKYSPDGTLIAFESDRTGSRGIWVSDAEGSNLVEVFGRGGSPRWSPDGQRLVFDSDVGGTAAIYVVRASGGKPVRLTYGPQASTTGSWSHDGNWIYFCSERDGQDQIWKIPAEGGDAVQVTGDGGFWPVESPDGKSLYFMRWSGDGNNKLWKIPVSGGVGSQILPSFFLCNYELMDDGIYFIRRPDKSGKAQLQFLSFAANAARTITTLPGQITFGLAVSPDRRYLLYSTDDLSGSDLMLVENFR